MIQATALILAGGISIRMKNINKALLWYNGKQFIEIALDKVKCFNERLIIAQKSDQYIYPDSSTLADLYPGRGPLCGIYTGLKEAKNEISVVLSIDTPFLEPKLLVHLAELCELYDAVVPKKKEYYQPLCAAYSQKCIPSIKNALDRGINKTNEIFDFLNIYYISEEEVNEFGDYENIFRNINTLKEYEDLIRQDDILNSHLKKNII
jgi:molybdopterin-guanine dinucleotide biosynthesis protein A